MREDNFVTFQTKMCRYRSYRQLFSSVILYKLHVWHCLHDSIALPLLGLSIVVFVSHPNGK